MPFEFFLFSLIVPQFEFGLGDASFSEHEADADVKGNFVNDFAILLQECFRVGFAFDQLERADGSLDFYLFCMAEQLRSPFEGLIEIPAKLTDCLIGNGVRAIGCCRHQNGRRFLQYGLEVGRFCHGW